MIAEGIAGMGLREKPDGSLRPEFNEWSTPTTATPTAEEERMRFGIFYEHQLPRPWERRTTSTSCSRTRSSRSSWPTGSASTTSGRSSTTSSRSTRTPRRPRCSSPPPASARSASASATASCSCRRGFNHPARVAERIATLDLVSDGRVEFGTGESVVAGRAGRLRHRPRRRSASSGRRRSTRSRACSSRSRSPATTGEYFADAAAQRRAQADAEAAPAAVGRVQPARDDPARRARRASARSSFAFIEPEEAQGVGRRLLRASSRPRSACPAGFAVNPNLAVVLPMMCHADEETAIERGLDGGHFFGYSLAHYYVFGKHRPGDHERVGRVPGEPRRVRASRARSSAPTTAPLGVKIMQQGLGSLRGAIGTPDQIARPGPSATRTPASTR